ncbi:unnamed protein product [Auanema sp. JU1783]|nr:unnamed protein product [Auanema sp. JU1783]
MPEVVDCGWLNDHLSNPKVKVLDVTHTVKPKRDFKTFDYGNFKQHMIENVEVDYVMSHIPDAVHFNLDAAFYPSEFIKSDIYPPALFEKYVQMLGINRDDEVIVYSRGPAGGMLFAARAWWTFKLYGHSNVKVLIGGFDQWKKQGFPVNGDHPTPPFGDWTAKPLDRGLLATFEELTTENSGGISENCSKVNYLDARPTDQYRGLTPLGVPADGATGSHITGSKNLPLAKIVNIDSLRTEKEIKAALDQTSYDSSFEIVTACNGGIQACLLSLGLAESGYRSKVYNGSMVEIGSRAPGLINSS